MGKADSNSDRHIIVAIGASAGGLQSLSKFFDDVPENTDCSFILIQHLSPDYESYTDQLLGRKTSIPISRVKDGEEIKKSHIYVIPPAKNLVISEGTMQLVDKPSGHNLNLPIDIFFESLADAYKQNVVGIIMSGTGSDGSKGVKHIKANGGLVIAQQPDQAKFPGMPQSAIDSNQADFVLPVEEMYGEIINMFNSPELVDVKQEIIHVDEKNLKNILDLIQEETNLDFNQYKKPTLLRRMSRRMKILQLDTIKEYYHYLQENEEEIKKLHDDFLIGVTSFFRDQGAWDMLKKYVIPEIVKFKDPGGEIKIWDIGCNTGEETYSIAMLFLEECAKQELDLKLKIFATDISKYHLDIASKGIYELNSIAEIKNDYIAKYFVKQSDGNYKVVDKLRRMVLFTEHDILKDPPFNRIDFAICRNLLIYLKNPFQQRVLKVIHYSLVLEGILMLGNSENLGSESKYYEEISRKWKLYRNIKTTPKSRNKIKDYGNAFHFKSEVKSKKRSKTQPESVRKKRRAEESLSAAILNQFNATTIQIDDDYQIIEAKGNLGRYANFPDEGFTTDLIKILPEELEIPIKTATRKAKKARSSVITERVKLTVNDSTKVVDLMVLPLLYSEMGREENYLITLVEKDISDFDNMITVSGNMDNAAADRIADLEEELDQTKQQLNHAIEETEASNEELQASNEELLASNEELQSTNEELQSVNEELHTVNNEHVAKMDELAALNADMDNLLDSTDIGVVYLDKSLCVRKFTPSIQEHFSFLDQDIGRHIDNFTLNFSKNGENNIVKKAKTVMETGKSIDNKIQSKSGRHFLKRITPFRNNNGDVVGVVIAFIDIEQIHQSQEEVNRSRERFKDFYDSDPVIHCSVNPNTGELVECNIEFYTRLGYEEKKDVIGKPIFNYYNEQSKIKASSLLEQMRKKGEIQNEEMTMVAKSGEEIPVLLTANLKEDEDGTLLTRSTLLDISHIKEIERKLRKQKSELEKVNENLNQFVSICSHDLQEPLSTIRFGSDVLEKKYADKLDDKGKEYISYIHQASARLGDQIKALLEHSKLGQNAEEATVDTAELVEVVKYDLSSQIAEKKAELHVGKLPVVTGYKTELRLLFQNLISNALKYSRDDLAPQIRISSFKDNGYVIFSVADNGQGIPSEDLDQIFTIFNRGNGEQKASGTGVGLAHCDKIVKMHHGKIWVDSTVGVGSTFHFKIKGN